MRKVVIIVITFALIFAILTMSAFAHPGRTDSKGGHHDRSTGEYHYHHGYEAHQHTNGKCPYDFNDKTDHSDNRGNGNSVKTYSPAVTPRSSPVISSGGGTNSSRATPTPTPVPAPTPPLPPEPQAAETPYFPTGFVIVGFILMLFGAICVAKESNKKKQQPTSLPPIPEPLPTQPQLLPEKRLQALHPTTPPRIRVTSKITEIHPYVPTFEDCSRLLNVDVSRNMQKLKQNYDNAANLKLLRYKGGSKTGVVEGSSAMLYGASLSFCPCDDFKFRRNACKHMYALAKYILEPVDLSDSLDPEQKPTYSEWEIQIHQQVFAEKIGAVKLPLRQTRDGNPIVYLHNIKSPHSIYHSINCRYLYGIVYELPLLCRNKHEPCSVCHPPK